MYSALERRVRLPLKVSAAEVKLARHNFRWQQPQTSCVVLDSNARLYGVYRATIRTKADLTAQGEGLYLGNIAWCQVVWWWAFTPFEYQLDQLLFLLCLLYWLPYMRPCHRMEIGCGLRWLLHRRVAMSLLSWYFLNIWIFPLLAIVSPFHKRHIVPVLLFVLPLSPVMRQINIPIMLFQIPVDPFHVNRENGRYRLVITEYWLVFEVMHIFTVCKNYASFRKRAKVPLLRMEGSDSWVASLRHIRAMLASRGRPGTSVGAFGCQRNCLPKAPFLSADAARQRVNIRRLSPQYQHAGIVNGRCRNATSRKLHSVEVNRDSIRGGDKAPTNMHEWKSLDVTWSLK